MFIFMLFKSWVESWSIEWFEPESETIIMYQEWRKVENKSSDKGSKIFHFLKMLKKDFSLIEHSERIIPNIVVLRKHASKQWIAKVMLQLAI